MGGVGWREMGSGAGRDGEWCRARWGVAPGEMGIGAGRDEKWCPAGWGVGSNWVRIGLRLMGAELGWSAGVSAKAWRSAPKTIQQTEAPGVQGVLVAMLPARAASRLRIWRGPQRDGGWH